MGERAVVLLKILLALDDKPLLIDQPEEYLDNRYIFDELVPAFRSAKKRRQIIIATHNANLSKCLYDELLRCCRVPDSAQSIFILSTT
jgi:predicted ATPase